MQAIGKLIFGLGAALAVYFCVDMLLGSKREPAKPRAVSGASDVDRSESERPRAQSPKAEPELPRVPLKPTHVDDSSDSNHEQPAVAPARPNGIVDLAATLEGEYATDALPTRDSQQREKVIGQFFSAANLNGKGQLEEVACRETICRGVVRIAEEEADNEVFSRTFLSIEFAQAVRDAIFVSSRQKMSDGSVLATFFIHPQSILDMVP